MQQNFILKYIVIGLLTTLLLVADIIVEESSDALHISSDLYGTVIIKVVAPDNSIIVDENYEGSSFTWMPSGKNGTYHYAFKVISHEKDTDTDTANPLLLAGFTSNRKIDFVTGLVTIYNHTIVTD